MSSLQICLNFSRRLIGSKNSILGNIHGIHNRHCCNNKYNLRNFYNTTVTLSSAPNMNSTENIQKQNIGSEHVKLHENEKTESSKVEQETAADSNAESVQMVEIAKALEEITKQRDDFNDRYKRALAESENMRSRLQKQIQEAKLFGIQTFCKDLLEVADILGKATECVPKEEVTDSNPHLKNLYEGLTMTEAQLMKVFQRHGLSPVNPLNEKFDPNLHEALFQQEVKDKTAGTVVVVSKIGYKLNERIIRPALVGIAKG